MLAVTSYKPDFVKECRAKVDRQLQSYKALAKAAPGVPLEAFAAEFFKSMVLALDHYFLHRLRNAESKDGNPLNEVRMLCNSIVDNNCIMQLDKTIKYDATKSVTGIKIGEEIKLNEAVFERLAREFFEEIEKKYP